MAKPTLKERLKAHFAEYGRVGIVVYLTCTLISIIIFAIAIGSGMEPSTATGVIGVIIASWLAAKVTIPIRIIVTLALTPPISALILRRRARKAPPVELGESVEDAPPEAPPATPRATTTE